MRRKYPKSALYWKEEQAVWPWRLFFAAEAVLYLWFMVSDVWGRTLLVPADVVKYLSMWGCFFMAAYLYAKKMGAAICCLLRR